MGIARVWIALLASVAGGTFTYSPTDHDGLTEKDIVLYRIEDSTRTLDQ